MTDSHDEFDRLLGPLRDRMVRIVWRILRNADDADDALQDALATIWKRFASVRAHRNPQAIVLRICNDSAHEVLRRKIRRLRREGLPLACRDGVAKANSPFDAIAQEDELARILGAIADLSKNQAAALLFRALDEMSYRDIGVALDCGEATARKHIARAREKLCVALSEIAPFNSLEAV